MSTFGLVGLAVASLGVGAFALTNRSSAAGPTSSVSSTSSAVLQIPSTLAPALPPSATPATSGAAATPTSTSAVSIATTLGLATGDVSGEGNDPESTDTTVGNSPSTTRSTAAPTTAVTSNGPLEAPETISLTCTAQPAPVAVHCEWKGLPAGTESRLLRGTNGSAAGEPIATQRGADAIDDETVQPGTNYAYRMYAVRADGNVVSVSPLVTVPCCGT
jgi:hypothetical protein